MRFRHIHWGENIKKVAFWRAVGCELLGTALLIFIGCGSVDLRINDESTVTAATTVKIALSFGFAINILIKTFGPISGCHINPAVSISFFVVGKVSLVRTIFYIVAQLIGALLGAGYLYGMLPAQYRKTLGLNQLNNGVSPAQGFGVEAALTFILVLAIASCLDERRIEFFKMKITNPLTIGLTVAALHLIGVCFLTICLIFFLQFPTFIFFLL